MRNKRRMIPLNEVVDPFVTIAIENDNIWVTFADSVLKMTRPAVDVIFEHRWDVIILTIAVVEAAYMGTGTDSNPGRKVNSILTTMDNTLNVPKTAVVGTAITG